LKHIKEAIAFVKGSDKRTLNKYITELSDAELIREAKGQTGVFDFAPFDLELLV
jgi:hypothetical protein